jgi:hypothetical protein
VLHIEDFKSFGFEPKDKYLFIIGHESTASVFAFVISSQTKYANHPFLKREQVHIPVKTIPGLPSESWIQCFHCVHSLSVASLEAGFTKQTVSYKGKLPPKFLQKVREVVYCSDVLKGFEIEDCLAAIDTDRSLP